MRAAKHMEATRPFMRTRLYRIVQNVVSALNFIKTTIWSLNFLADMSIMWIASKIGCNGTAPVRLVDTNYRQMISCTSEEGKNA